MDLQSILIAVIVILAATAACVILFERLGFGAILGFIVAGIIIGPHTPGPVPVQAVEELQSVAELGVVLFLFTVGLEMQPKKVWAMRRLIFGIGSGQILITAALLAAYLVIFVHLPWETAIMLGLTLGMSSTAIVMATLEERGALATEHGRTMFAVLMAQDLAIVPIMALVPILAHQAAQTSMVPLWEKITLVLAVIAGIFIVGRYLLPAVLGYCANQRQMDAFGVILFLSVITAAWAIDYVGISMTLGAFLLGMLLSGSDFRYQIEANVAPFKQTLMGLFFIAVGMSIDVGALLSDWSTLLVHLSVVLTLKVAVLVGLILAFGIGRSVAIRTGFYLSQVGEFAFVLLGAATVAGLISPEGHTLAMLVVAVSMIMTPLMVKVGDRLANRLQHVGASEKDKPDVALDKHVIIIGYGEVGQLIDLMLEKAKIPHVAFDMDLRYVIKGRRLSRNVHFGDMYNSTTQAAAKTAKAAAAYLTSEDIDHSKALAVTLHRLYPHLNIYVRVETLWEQAELVAKGIKNARTGYIESTLVCGSKLLKDLGVSEDEASELVKEIQHDDYALIRSGYGEFEKQQQQ
jgi:glutathione-regulated potassium-efflux system protein KefB